jgi:hypothetical protein
VAVAAQQDHQAQVAHLEHQALVLTAHLVHQVKVVHQELRVHQAHLYRVIDLLQHQQH